MENKENREEGGWRTRENDMENEDEQRDRRRSKQDRKPNQKAAEGNTYPQLTPSRR